MPVLATSYVDRSNEITNNSLGAVDINNKLVINSVDATRDNQDLEISAFLGERIK
ncbi:MAG: hypothetical protein M3297_16105 [Thermoproteota archaeon]|jgi:hypothetical protein|nr:hypothetical protein [Thermoproteota archaeon]